MTRFRTAVGRVRRAAGRVLRRSPEPPSTGDLWRVVRAEVARWDGTSPVRVAVVHPDGPPAWIHDLEASGCQVTAVPADLPDDQRHLLLTARGPFEVVVDAARGSAAQTRRLFDCFYHLRPDGTYVVRGAAAELGPEPGKLGEVLERAAATRGEPIPQSKPGVSRTYIDDHALGRAIVGQRVDGRHLVLVSGARDVFRKLRDPQLAELLELRPDILPVRTIRTIPAEAFELRCEFQEVGTQVTEPPTSYDGPAAPLREYTDVVAMPGQLVVRDQILLPDSFRHWPAKRLRNRFLDEHARWFARVRDDSEPTTLSGPFFHLDSEERGHYGHLMTEQLSRLWGWAELKAAHPDLKALLCTNFRPELMPYEYEIYEAAGIAPEDLVLVHGPVRVEKLFAAAPLFSNPFFVHPQIVETWDQLGDSLAARAEGGPRPERMFCSRRLKKRACRNTEEVEQVFAERGFEVVFPEDYSLGDQVEMFRSAKVVAGFAGSGLFNLCFVKDPVHVVSLRSEAYTAFNEHMMAALRGHSMQSIVSRPENPMLFQSPWSVDFENEGRQLIEILDALPR